MFEFILVFISIFKIVCYFNIFNKCGEKGWKAIIPFLDIYTRFKLNEGHFGVIPTGANVKDGEDIRHAPVQIEYTNKDIVIYGIDLKKRQI